jgi:hypothetical protein
MTSFRYDVRVLPFSDTVARSPRLLRAASLHLEARPIRCVRGLKSSLVIQFGQKAQIGPNPFTPRGRADLIV